MWGAVRKLDMPGWRPHPKNTNHWQYIGPEVDPAKVADAPVLGGFTYADYAEPSCFMYVGTWAGGIVPRPGEAGANGAHCDSIQQARGWVEAKVRLREG